jgi:hypothetical protein
MEKSDYIIYVDESGDHSLTSIDPQFPVFTLAFCIIEKRVYARDLAPKIQEMKFRWFGHDMVVFHEHEIRKAKAPFVFLGDPEKRTRFMDEISTIMADAAMTIVAGVIQKQPLVARYVQPMNPYHLALLFCMEQSQKFLQKQGQSGKLTHIVAEARSPREHGGVGREDMELAEVFKSISEGHHPLRERAILRGFELVFADKKANSAGLQLADLVARPIALATLRPDQPNRAYDVIKDKLMIRVFP